MDFPCKACNKVLKRKDSLKNHTRRFHPFSKDETIKCPFCSKSFSRTNDMKKHAAKFHPYEDIDKLPTNSKDLEPKDVNLKDVESKGKMSKDVEPKDAEPNDAENYSCSEIINEDNSLLTYEEMIGSPARVDCETASICHENMTDVNRYCNAYSKEFKTRKKLSLHSNKIHNKISEDDEKHFVEVIFKVLNEQHGFDILEMSNTLKRLTGYIRTNAENITELLNTQNNQNSQIKNIGELLAQRGSSGSIQKVFNCPLCPKNFSSKPSLYTHKNRYHKQRERLLKCQKCDDSFENETDMAIHGFRFHRATL